MQADKHLKLLGLKVKDCVTGFKGVVTGINFDLYGCVQAIVTRELKNNDDKIESRWFDITRLIILKTKPVMALPNFNSGYIAEGKKGAADKPLP